MKDFILKNKVFLSGLAAAIVVAIQGFSGQPETNWKVVGYAALMAVLSYLANTWRGQGTSIAGIVGTLAATFVTLNQTGSFTWSQFILQAIAAILAIVAPPPKLLSYEKDPVIEKAKE